MRRFWPILILLMLAAWCASGCRLLRSIADEVPEPPTVGADCNVASDDPYLVAALEDALIPSLDGVPNDPAGARAEAEKRIRNAGFEIQVKTGTGKEAERSTTLPGLVLLERDFDNLEPDSQATIVWHEYAHVVQYDDLGDAVFLARYGLSMGRVSLELPAYRMSFRLRRHLGKTFTIDDYRNAVRRFHGSYGISVPLQCVETWALNAWNES